MEVEKKCKDLVKENWKSRKEDFDTFIKNYENDTEDENLGKFEDYGLNVELIKAGEDSGSRSDYICYQLSWGGPSDEIRFFKNGDIEYWYMDWFDGASIDITKDKTAIWLKEYFNELGYWENQ